MELFGKEAMKMIYKYPLAIVDDQTITMPEGVHLLTVQEQNGALCLWAMVNPEARPREVRLRVIGTGHPIPDGLEGYSWLATAQTAGGRLVWHVFVDINVYADSETQREDTLSERKP
jgi:hypothetical protein